MNKEEFFTLLLLEHGTNPTPVYGVHRNTLVNKLTDFWWKKSTVMQVYIPTPELAEEYLIWLYRSNGYTGVSAA